MAWPVAAERDRYRFSKNCSCAVLPAQMVGRSGYLLIRRDEMDGWRDGWKNGADGRLVGDIVESGYVENLIWGKIPDCRDSRSGWSAFTGCFSVRREVGPFCPDRSG